jgi:hypothetical protein
MNAGARFIPLSKLEHIYLRFHEDDEITFNFVAPETLKTACFVVVGEGEEEHPTSQLHINFESREIRVS